jgi:hypothetical protein
MIGTGADISLNPEHHVDEASCGEIPEKNGYEWYTFRAQFQAKKRHPKLLWQDSGAVQRLEEINTNAVAMIQSYHYNPG